jgi:hypothetical protein
MAGDHTLEAIHQAIADVVAPDDEVGNESLLIAISDANLKRYDIHPRALGKTMELGSDSGVKSHCIFIASLGQEAE